MRIPHTPRWTVALLSTAAVLTPLAEPAAALPATAPAKCTAGTSPYQREVERFLRLKADGRQSTADCEAVRAYQRAQIIEPANGYAGPITRNALYWEWAIYHTKDLKGCPKRKGRVVCVELTHQILWVKQNGKLLVAPVQVRSGRASHPTRTGWFRIGTRHKDHWSTLYDSPMPFAQFFSGGQALHGVYSNLYKEPASYGCVNLRYEAAELLWKKLRTGDRVYVWGRRPGT